MEQPNPIVMYIATYSKLGDKYIKKFSPEESLEEVRNLGLEEGYDTFTITDGKNTIQGETNGVMCYNKDKPIDGWFEDMRRAKEQERRPAKGEYRPFCSSTKFVALG